MQAVRVPSNRLGNFLYTSKQQKGYYFLKNKSLPKVTYLRCVDAECQVRACLRKRDNLLEVWGKHTHEPDPLKMQRDALRMKMISEGANTEEDVEEIFEKETARVDEEVARSLSFGNIKRSLLRLRKRKKTSPSTAQKKIESLDNLDEILSAGSSSVGSAPAEAWRELTAGTSDGEASSSAGTTIEDVLPTDLAMHTEELVHLEADLGTPDLCADYSALATASPICRSRSPTESVISFVNSLGVQPPSPATNMSDTDTFNPLKSLQTTDDIVPIDCNDDDFSEDSSTWHCLDVSSLLKESATRDEESDSDDDDDDQYMSPLGHREPTNELRGECIRVPCHTIETEGSGTSEDDPDYIFLLSLLPDLQQLSSALKMEFKTEVMNLLKEKQRSEKLMKSNWGKQFLNSYRLRFGSD